MLPPLYTHGQKELEDFMVPGAAGAAEELQQEPEELPVSLLGQIAVEADLLLKVFLAG